MSIGLGLGRSVCSSHWAISPYSISTLLGLFPGSSNQERKRTWDTHHLAPCPYLQGWYCGGETYSLSEISRSEAWSWERCYPESGYTRGCCRSSRFSLTLKCSSGLRILPGKKAACGIQLCLIRTKLRGWRDGSEGKGTWVQFLAPTLPGITDICHHAQRVSFLFQIFKCLPV